jgi:hypothetical protein
MSAEQQLPLPNFPDGSSVPAYTLAEPLSIEPAPATDNTFTFEAGGVLEPPAVEAPAEVQSAANKSYGQKLGEIGASVKGDFREGRHWSIKALSGAAMIGTQIVDRSRLTVVWVPTVALDVFKATGNPVETGLAAGALFGAWCLGVGGTLTEGLAQFPNTTNSVDANFPGLTGFFEDALPGFNTNPEAEQQRSAARRIGSKILMHLRRGGAAIGVGNTAYVATATAKGRRKAKIHELSAATAGDGGVVMATFIGGVAGVIKAISYSNPELALRIQHDASNANIWYGLAGVLLSSQYLATRHQKKQARKTAAAAEVEA